MAGPGFAQQADAATLLVTTTADEFGSGERCSLREAVWSANNNSNERAPGCATGGRCDRIELPAGVHELTRQGVNEDAAETGDLDIYDDARILHQGLSPATIDGKGIDRVIHVLPSPFLGACNMGISGVTIRGGAAMVPGSDRGGGILNMGQLVAGSFTLTGNRAIFGGGFAQARQGAATLRQATISGNRADRDGGGVFTETRAQVVLPNTTVAYNVADANEDGEGSGGGLAAAGEGNIFLDDISLVSTLVASNLDRGGEANDCVEIGGQIESQGGAFIGDIRGCDYRASGNGRDIRNRDAHLGPLLPNGGPTPTHALGRKSRAINRGGNCGSRLPVDQRGAPRRFGRSCDIGAYERVLCAGVVVTEVGTPGRDHLVGTSRRDGILGGGGGDRIRGRGGDDALCGDSAGFSQHLGAGIDVLDGGGDRDVCVGGPAPDRAQRCEILVYVP